jgi:hypothetical protein
MTPMTYWYIQRGSDGEILVVARLRQDEFGLHPEVWRASTGRWVSRPYVTTYRVDPLAAEEVDEATARAAMQAMAAARGRRVWVPALRLVDAAERATERRRIRQARRWSGARAVLGRVLGGARPTPTPGPPPGSPEGALAYEKWGFPIGMDEHGNLFPTDDPPAGGGPPADESS